MLGSIFYDSIVGQTELDASNSGLSPEAILLLGRIVGASKTIKKLDVSYNAIGENAKAFGEAIATAPVLESINMAHNALGAYARSFGEAVSAVPKLKDLDLGHNNIDKKAVYSLAPYLGAIKIVGLPSFEEVCAKYYSERDKDKEEGGVFTACNIALDYFEFDDAPPYQLIASMLLGMNDFTI